MDFKVFVADVLASKADQACLVINDLCALSSKRMFALQYLRPTAAMAVLKRVAVSMGIDKEVVRVVVE